MFNKIYSKIKEYFICFIILFIILTILILYKIKLPYTIYMPGGTTNISNNIKVVDESLNTGTYKSLYVLTSDANVLTYLISKIKKNWDLKKNEDISLNINEDYNDILKRDKLLLKYSNNTAIKIAYQKANKKYEVIKNNIYVIGSECDIKIGEQLLRIDGFEINSLEDVRNVINSKEIGEEVEVETIINNKLIKRNLKVKMHDDIKAIGIYIIDIPDIKLDKDVKINDESNEAGSSSGLIRTLSIYDKITDFDLSKGLKIVGTGTIEEDGSVDKISGLKYKMLGLSKEKYDVFFIPYKNKEEADEINKNYNLNLRYVPVNTFDEAVDYLLSVNN